MQPKQPNPWLIVNFIFTKMISAAGAKEAELQGASSVVRGNAVIEAVQARLNYRVICVVSRDLPVPRDTLFFCCIGQKFP